MWYLTIHRWTGERPTGESDVMTKHLRWMRDQERAGKVLIAGPTPDFELGIVVFGHMSADELNELCGSEPLVAAGLRTFEVYPWEVHCLLGIGGFSVEALTAMALANQD